LNILIKLTLKNENLITFENLIYSIKQSKNTGYIFIYSDKKIYMFFPPNLINFLSSSEEKENFSLLLKEENKKNLV